MHTFIVACAVLLFIAASGCLAAVTMTEYKVYIPAASDRYYSIGREREGHKSGIMCVNYFGEYQPGKKTTTTTTTSCYKIRSVVRY